MILVCQKPDINDIFSSINRDKFFSKESWKNIQQCRINFFEDAEDPRNSQYVDKEIARSWIYLRDRGINPNSLVTKEWLNSEALEKTIEKNRLLIEVTNSIIRNFKYVMFYSGYIIYLIDKNGIILLQDGDWESLVPFSKQKSLTGLIMNDTSMGNSSHMLCMYLKEPVQLLGPEHYSAAFQNNIASATPLFDEHGEVIASLVLLSQTLVNPTWEDSLPRLSLHTLGLIIAMGVAIETQIKLLKSSDNLIRANNNLMQVNESLETSYNMLEATLAFTDGGLITVDRFGDITHINQKASRILRLTHSEAISRNISDFLTDKSFITKALTCGEPVSYRETTFKIGKNEENYILTIRSMHSQDPQIIRGAVIRIVHPDKINALASLRAGFQAKFGFNDIIGDCNEIRKVKDIAQRFSLSSENILLIGESGTGKELFAQAIHNNYCPQGPFVAINCASMPRSLIESELFGYESGSFTGADSHGKPGKIELANGGTLFLDEIGDMPYEVQAVLLRVLEDKQVMRVGGKRYQEVDFRVVAATNRNLLKMVQENQFREDLYYRLSVLRISIPPLRQRENDIILLCQYFINTYCDKTGKSKPQMSPAAIKKILEYNWPGNVRQLENAVIYAINITQSDVINIEHLPYELFEDVREVTNDKNNITENEEILPMRVWEKAAIKSTLLKSHNSIAQAASILQISKSTLYRKIKEYDITL